MVAKARLCSRQTCTREAVFTLTYSYADSSAVIGALSQVREPHAYDLCEFHSSRLTAPQGWEVVRVGPARVLADDERESANQEQPGDAGLSNGPAYPTLRSVN